MTFACNFRKLESARTLLKHGADAREDQNYPLFRAGLADDQETLLDLLLENGADVNAVGLSFDGTDWGPVVLGACETLAPSALRWFIDNGADVDFFYERANGNVLNCADMLIKDLRPTAGETRGMHAGFVRCWSTDTRNAVHSVDGKRLRTP